MKDEQQYNFMGGPLHYEMFVTTRAILFMNALYFNCFTSHLLRLLSQTALCLFNQVFQHLSLRNGLG